MQKFKSFISEDVTYNKPDHKRLADEEHSETTTQSDALKKHKEFRNDTHPAIQKAIHHFAKNKDDFHKAMSNSKVQKVKHGTKVGNTEMGMSMKHVEDKEKVKRVQGMIKKKKPIDRPIILRHTDKQGQQHHHLLAGNTRATAVGHGVEAHHVDV
jgi:hypothetical protein